METLNNNVEEIMDAVESVEVLDSIENTMGIFNTRNVVVGTVIGAVALIGYYGYKRFKSRPIVEGSTSETIVEVDEIIEDVVEDEFDIKETIIE